MSCTSLGSYSERARSEEAGLSKKTVKRRTKGVRIEGRMRKRAVTSNTSVSVKRNPTPSASLEEEDEDHLDER